MSQLNLNQYVTSLYNSELYKEGLNHDTNDRDCLKFRFTTLRNLPYILRNGHSKIADVEIAPGAKVTDDHNWRGTIYKVDKFILKNITPIEDHPCWKDVEYCKRALAVNWTCGKYVKDMDLKDILEHAMFSTFHMLDRLDPRIGKLFDISLEKYRIHPGYNAKNYSSYEVFCRHLVSRDGNILQEIEEQTPDVCLAAIKQNPKSIRYVKDQTEELCDIVVSQCGYSVQYVRNPTFKNAIRSVKVTPKSLQYLSKKMPELCMLAVVANGDALAFVEEQTDELCFAAVRNYGIALRFVKNQTDELCLEAVKQTPDAFQFVKDQTDELCTKARGINWKITRHVKQRK
jgi:hypothetical protein